jgi:hypothetical protein
MAATRLRVCLNSGETQEIKTGGWFIGLLVYYAYLPVKSTLRGDGICPTPKLE